jgi:hypothetical protein
MSWPLIGITTAYRPWVRPMPSTVRATPGIRLVTKSLLSMYALYDEPTER